MNRKELSSLSETVNHTDKMSVLFLGHGSPMNAIEENEFVATFRNLGKEIIKPKAILCISAHWETKGTLVTAMQKPKTIHDFVGFPQALYEVQYSAAGSPQLAEQTKELVTKTPIGLDYNWGLDHGAWSVLKHLFPAAEVPVVQMSIDYSKNAQYHFDLAKQLSSLRRKGVLIVGSGNMVHNLSRIAWDKINGAPYGHAWAIEANEKMKSFILDRNYQGLINFKKYGTAFDLAIPTPEHYLPLIYTMALQEKNEDLSIFNDQPVGGSIYMTSLKIG